jgi:hypothetical protein
MREPWRRKKRIEEEDRRESHGEELRKTVRWRRTRCGILGF